MEAQALNKNSKLLIVLFAVLISLLILPLIFKDFLEVVWALLLACIVFCITVIYLWGRDRKLSRMLPLLIHIFIVALIAVYLYWWWYVEEVRWSMNLCINVVNGPPEDLRVLVYQWIYGPGGREFHCSENETITYRCPYFQTKGSYFSGNELTIEVMSSNETRYFNFTVPALTRCEAGEYKIISLSAWPRLGDVGWEVWRYPIVLDYTKAHAPGLISADTAPNCEELYCSEKFDSLVNLYRASVGRWFRIRTPQYPFAFYTTLAVFTYAQQKKAALGEDGPPDMWFILSV